MIANVLIFWRHLFGVVTSQFRVLIDDVSNVESLNMAPKGLIEHIFVTCKYKAFFKKLSWSMDREKKVKMFLSLQNTFESQLL